MNKIIALISTVLLLPYPTFALEIASNPSSQPASESSYCQLEAENGDLLSEKQLQSLAHKSQLKLLGIIMAVRELYLVNRVIPI